MMEEPHEQQRIDCTLNKCPYLCETTNLIENFLIVGYDNEIKKNDIYKEIEYDVMEGNKPKNEVGYFSVYTPRQQPEVLNSITTSNDDKPMLEYDLITKLIFPMPPSIYYITDPLNHLGKKHDPNSYSVVFFMNSDKMDSTSKVPFHGYTFIFYEKHELKIEAKGLDEASTLKSLRIYVPKGFTIISQFPFFSQFFQLAKSIHDLYQSDKELEIPIELLIYNIIHFTPAPINRNMNISFLPVGDLAYIKKNHEKQLQANQQNPNQINTNIDIKQNSSYNFGCLSGYPLFDFNLSEIFNIVHLEIIVEILIFNFLEIDMLFFSKNIEVLNLVMYIIASLNYPCNDSIYLWHIVSVSKDELEDYSAVSRFIGKPCTTMVGINTSYRKDIDTSMFQKAMFIADLDQKDLSFKYNDQKIDKNDRKEIDKLVKLYYYIDDIIASKSPSSNPSMLEMNIRKLVSELDVKCKKVINANQNHITQIIPKFLTNDVNHQMNKSTQELFYSFILNIMKTFYTQYATKFNPSNNNTLPSHYSFENKSNEYGICEEEKIFYEFLSECTKSSNYLYNFLTRQDSMELYHIPLIFSEEFLQLNIEQDDEYSKTPHLDIIDNFYNKDSKIDTFHFKDFYIHYNDEMKEKFSNEILDSSLINIVKKKILNKKKTIYQYKSINFDNNVLFRYIHYLNNLSQVRLEKIFPSTTREHLSNIPKVQYSSIAQEIEMNYLKNKTFKMNDLICMSIILFYGVTIEHQSEEEFEKQFGVVYELLGMQIYCLRQYITKLMYMYYCHALKLRKQAMNYKYILNAYHRLLHMVLVREIPMNKELLQYINNFIIIDNEYKDHDDFISKIDSNDEIYCDFVNDRKSIKDDQVSDSRKTMSFFAPSTFERLSLSNSRTTMFNSDPFKGNKAPKKNKTFHETNPEYAIFLSNNKCKDGFNKEEFILKMAENISFEGDITFICSLCNETIYPIVCYRGKINHKSIESFPFSPLKIYKLCLNLSNQTNINLDTPTNVSLLNRIMINLLFYHQTLNDITIRKPMLAILRFK